MLWRVCVNKKLHFEIMLKKYSCYNNFYLETLKRSYIVPAKSKVNSCLKKFCETINLALVDVNARMMRAWYTSFVVTINEAFSIVLTSMTKHRSTVGNTGINKGKNCANSKESNEK